MAAATLAGGDDDGSDDDANSPYAVLGRWIEENPDEDTKARSLAIYKKAQDLGIEKTHKTVTVLVQALFTANIVAEVESYGALLTKVVTSEKHQKSLLGGVERFIGFTHPDLIATVPKILMAFYQIDLLDEEGRSLSGAPCQQKVCRQRHQQESQESQRAILESTSDYLFYMEIQ